MLTEYESAVLLVDEVLETLKRIEASLDLAISINVPDPQQQQLVKQGGQMACELMKSHLEDFKTQAALNLIKSRNGMMQA